MVLRMGIRLLIESIVNPKYSILVTGHSVFSSADGTPNLLQIV